MRLRSRRLPTPALVEVTKYRPVVNEHFLGFQSHANSFSFLARGFMKDMSICFQSFQLYFVTTAMFNG